jgi:hypothetical protein
MNEYVRSTHVQKRQLYRWIGLIIGLILGLVIAFFYYNWAKKEASVHFQKNIGEGKFMTELGKWQEKNPFQARQMNIESWKELGIYDELKSETNPEIINQKVVARIEELNDDEKNDFEKKSMKLYKEYAPAFLESFEEKFPWYLRYSRTIIFSIILVSSGIGFLFGYLLEPEERKIIYNY